MRNDNSVSHPHYMDTRTYEARLLSTTVTQTTVYISTHVRVSEQHHICLSVYGSSISWTIPKIHKRGCDQQFNPPVHTHTHSRQTGQQRRDNKEYSTTSHRCGINKRQITYIDRLDWITSSVGQTEHSSRRFLPDQSNFILRRYHQRSRRREYK